MSDTAGTRCQYCGMTYSTATHRCPAFETQPIQPPPVSFDPNVYRRLDLLESLAASHWTPHPVMNLQPVVDHWVARAESAERKLQVAVKALKEIRDPDDNHEYAYVVAHKALREIGEPPMSYTCPPLEPVKIPSPHNPPASSGEVVGYAILTEKFMSLSGTLLYATESGALRDVKRGETIVRVLDLAPAKPGVKCYRCGKEDVTNTVQMCPKCAKSTVPNTLSRTIRVICERLREGEDRAAVERDYGLDLGDLAGINVGVVTNVTPGYVYVAMEKERDDAKLRVKALEDLVDSQNDSLKHLQSRNSELEEREPATVAEFERKLEARNREIATLKGLIAEMKARIGVWTTCHGKLVQHVSDWRTFGDKFLRPIDDVERALYPERKFPERRGD